MSAQELKLDMSSLFKDSIVQPAEFYQTILDIWFIRKTKKTFRNCKLKDKPKWSKTGAKTEKRS